MGFTNVQAIMAGYSTLPIGKQAVANYPRKNEFLPAYAMKGTPNLTQPETRNFDPNAGTVRGGLYLLG